MVPQGAHRVEDVDAVQASRRGVAGDVKDALAHARGALAGRSAGPAAPAQLTRPWSA